MFACSKNRNETVGSFQAAVGMVPIGSLVVDEIDPSTFGIQIFVLVDESHNCAYFVLIVAYA